MQVARHTFTSTSTGLNPELYPMRLFQKAKKLGVWDPAKIDFSQDAADWQSLSDIERDLLLRLTAQFIGGEESVTYDLLPLLLVAADDGRIEEEMFLTSYLFEEAKHVEGFARFLSEVVGDHGDLSHYLTPSYCRIFMEEQPAAMNRLRTDASPIALAEAAVTYQMITEGVLAETGYHAYFTVLKEHNLMPGMQELVQNIQRDESR
ncbi:MAG: R2-like ligand-binding oxidase, partial [Bacteroidota bacterium]